NTIIDGDQDGQTIMTENGPMLSIEENIRIYGGDIVYDENQDDKTFRWNMCADFKKDIDSMWDICRQDARLWNTQICVFEVAERLNGYTDDLKVSVPTDYLKDAVKRNGGTYVVIRRIMDGLYNAGLLKEYSINDDVFSITYKNEQVKYCLTVAGQVLEMKVFLAALESHEKDGSFTYNDVMNGVFIDWDGNLHLDQEDYDTENEIDVLMMHGMIPVFVSCKNGYIDKDELYKLNAVATRFGGKYAKKVLVATALDNSDFSNYLRQRAEDMGIRLVEGYSHNGKYKDFVDMDDVEINRVIRSLWSN
ncbi:MAG: Card1-like endonuclease domain-containing protein, partial [Eubacteriales bacterium]